MKRSLFQWMECLSDARYLKYSPVTFESEEERMIAYSLLSVTEEKPVLTWTGSTGSLLRLKRNGFWKVTALPRFDTGRRNSLINRKVIDFRVSRCRLKYHILFMRLPTNYPFWSHVSFICVTFSGCFKNQIMCACNCVCLLTHTKHLVECLMSKELSINVLVSDHLWGRRLISLRIKTDSLQRMDMVVVSASLRGGIMA